MNVFKNITIIVLAITVGVLSTLVYQGQAEPQPTPVQTANTKTCTHMKGVEPQRITNGSTSLYVREVNDLLPGTPEVFMTLTEKSSQKCWSFFVERTPELTQAVSEAPVMLTYASLK